ncbi:LexA family protein [Fictibacillus phosphorivorans]|uniref:LexA family protein n=1 Tax=Fictibacillus phosphorivorans TaxID=1221500 RepID=UPI003CF5D7DB
MEYMDYSHLVDMYIKNSGLSLSEIAQKMKDEKGVKVDRTYISKLRKNPKYAASDDINRALAEVTGGDPNKLVWAGMIFGSDPLVKEALMLIDDEVITKAMDLIQKYPGYFDMSEEEQEKLKDDTDVRMFWNMFSKSMSDRKNNHSDAHSTGTKNNDLLVNESIIEYNPTHMIPIPVLGSIQAGSPIEMIENNEGFTLVDPNVLNGKEGFALKVKGESMIGDRIHEGDVVICTKEVEVLPKDIAVVRVNGDHATLKRVKQHGDMCMLVPSNPTMEPQLVPAKDVHILGKVVEVKFWPK